MSRWRRSSSVRGHDFFGVAGTVSLIALVPDIDVLWFGLAVLVLEVGASV